MYQPCVRWSLVRVAYGSRYAAPLQLHARDEIMGPIQKRYCFANLLSDVKKNNWNIDEKWMSEVGVPHDSMYIAAVATSEI